VRASFPAKNWPFPVDPQCCGQLDFRDGGFQARREIGVDPDLQRSPPLFEDKERRREHPR